MIKNVSNKKILLLFLILGSALHCIAQNVVVKGKVRDESGETLPGVSVTVKDSHSGTTTNADGSYELSVPAKSILIFSFVGYAKEEVPVNGRSVLDVRIKSDIKALEEVVVVGFGTQKKVTVTGAITTVTGTELQKAPVVNLSQALVGRTPGLLAQQGSGQPGNDNVDLRIRGQSTLGSAAPLVLVDGVQRNFNSIDASEIENITVLKDAATTAVYGILGANGVILVTTRRGKTGKPTVSYTSNFSNQSPTRLPEFVNSADFARLYNQGYMNDNPQSTPAQLPFSAEDIRMYEDGSDPVLHPNANWFDMMMKKGALQQKHNVNVRGGSNSARYFVSLSYTSQDGLWKEFNQKYNYSNNDKYKRYNFRSNIDLDITKTTTASLLIGGIFGNKNRNRGNPFWMMMNTSPLSTPGLVGDKIVLIPTITPRNPLLDVSGGYNNYRENQLNLGFEIKQDLDFLLNGLSARIRTTYDSNYEYNYSQVVTRAQYYPEYRTVDGEQVLVYRPINDETIGGVSGVGFGKREKRAYTEAAVEYKRSFAKHSVTGLLLYNQSKQHWHDQQYPDVPLGYIGMVGRLTYSYDYRYMLEFNMGRNGSENFPENSRFGWFPAISAGWNITREPFVTRWLNGEKIISNLKLRASYGEVGNDRSSGRRFMYFPSEYVTASSGQLFGESRSALQQLREGKIGNPDITWERSVKQNYGLESAFLGNRFTVDFDYFVDKRDNILASPNSIPDHVAAVTQDVYNLAKVENHGFELVTGWNDKIGKSFTYFFNVNYSYAKNKIVFNDEAKDPNNPNLWRTGRAIGQPFGLKSVGFINSEEEANTWPMQFGTQLTPGDVKYEDVNGDGMINERDETPIGYPVFPQVNYGISGGFTFKAFDFSFLFQGADQVSRYIDGFFRKPGVQIGQILSTTPDEVWTPDNMANAKRPKMSVGYSNVINYRNSDLWIQDASYLRLKNIEFGYNINGPGIKRLKINSVRLYISGQNLFTWDTLKIVDPENKADDAMAYPQVRVLNAGINLQF